MRRLSPLIALAVLTIALYGTIVSFHNLVHGYGSSFAYLNWLLGLEDVEYGVESEPLRWDTALTSKELIWKPCHPEAVTRIECSRLAVPLNYSEPNGEQASIALARIPSPLQNTSSYRGPILLNPGGPGASGTGLVLRAGVSISLVVGPQFDLVGFDPRGVGDSRPAVSFFDTHLERMLWEAVDGPVLGATHVLNISSDGLARTWARSHVVGQLAAKQADVLRHINTDHTARDMLSIVEAHGFEKLQYWGFSYGSVLGSTFAAMFPDKVGRLVIDGVVDMEDYYEGLWSANLVDTNKTMDSFYTSCHSAGPAACAFWDSTPVKIRQNLNDLYASLLKRPIPIAMIDGTSNNYGLIDYSFLRMAVFSTLYKPWPGFPILAQALADLQEAVAEMNSSATSYELSANKAGQKLFKLYHQAPMKCADACGCSGGDAKLLTPLRDDAKLAIACNDGSPVPPEFEHLEKYFEDLNKRSEWGDLWAGIRAGCIGWPDLPKKHFRGPIRGKTSHPLLIIGNTADPVTPLGAAKKTSKSFPGSVVLTQDSPGHCSLSAPSPCTQLHVRNYFATGALPKPGTVCPVLVPPFISVGTKGVAFVSAEGEGSQVTFDLEKLSSEEKELVDAAWELTKTFSPAFPI